MTPAEKSRLKRAGLTKLNTPKRTPNHKTKKAVVGVRVKLDMVKILLKENLQLHFGQIKFFGLEKVVVLNHHQGHKSMLKELEEGKHSEISRSI